MKKYLNIIILSTIPKNKITNFEEFKSNIISIGVSLESQLTSLINFIKKEKKNKTVIMLSLIHI